MQRYYTLNFRFDIHWACRTIMENEFQRLGVSYRFLGTGEVEIPSDLKIEKLQELKDNFNKYGITILENPNESLTLQIKEVIKEMIDNENTNPSSKTSTFLSHKLNMSYSYISTIFSEMTLSTIENYIILQKIEKVKRLIINGELTLTEIAHQLNYSSVAHLSNQFKKTTGLTPSAFQRIIKKKSQSQSST